MAVARHVDGMKNLSTTDHHDWVKDIAQTGVCVRDTQNRTAKPLSLRNTLHAPTGVVTPFFFLTQIHAPNPETNKLY